MQKLTRGCDIVAVRFEAMDRTIVRTAFRAAWRDQRCIHRPDVAARRLVLQRRV
jgi:hypothetical protein